MPQGWVAKIRLPFSNASLAAFVLMKFVCKPRIYLLFFIADSTAGENEASSPHFILLYIISCASVFILNADAKQALVNPWSVSTSPSIKTFDAGSGFINFLKTISANSSHLCWVMRYILLEFY